MITHNFNTLDLLTSPVWIVSPFEEQLIYANSAAKLLMQDLTFSQLRTGPYSVSSQKELPKYLSDLQNQHDIIEILTVQRKEEETALSCRLVLRKLTETEPVISCMIGMTRRPSIFISQVCFWHIVSWL